MTVQLAPDATDDLPSDPSLIAAVRGGDEEAFRLMYRRHTPRLRRIVSRILGSSDSDADDVLQDVWVRAVRKLGDFRRESAFSTWLCGIAVRVSRESLRRRRLLRLPASDDTERVPGPPAHDSERIDLETAIAELPVHARTIVVLHDVEGFTHEEIAKHFGIATGTSKSQLFRAHEILRRRLGGTIA